MHVVTPDLVSTNPQGGTTAYDVVVVGVTHKDGYEGAAAARAEKKKHEHYKTTTKESAEMKETLTQGLKLNLSPWHWKPRAQQWGAKSKS